jgi:hypothetical protein
MRPVTGNLVDVAKCHTLHIKAAENRAQNQYGTVMAALEKNAILRLSLSAVNDPQGNQKFSSCLEKKQICS